MKWRAHATSIALALAAAGAVGYAWLDRGSVSETEKKMRAGTVFVGWRREDLTRIAIEHPGESIVLERTDDDAGGYDWWLRAPLPERANADAVDKLLAALEFATVVRKVDPTLKAPGIDAPRAKGTIAMGSLVHTFALGDDAATPAGAAYLKVDGGDAVVVGRELVTALMQKADAYRSRSVVPYLSVELRRLDVKSEGGGFSIERGDDVSFRLEPSGLRASRAKLDEVWSALSVMRAESFVDVAQAEAIVATPRVTVTMTPLDASRPNGVLRVGGACPDPKAKDDVVVLRDAPSKLAACAPASVTGGLSLSDAALIDTRLFAAHDDEIAEVRIESLPSGPALELARKENGWRERAPVERDLEGDDAAIADALVSAIARSEGADPTRSDAPFEARGRVTVHRADKGAVEVVELSAPDANGDVVAKRAFDGARLHVGAAVARKLAPRGVALRGREAWTPRLEGVPVSAIETACGDVDQRVEKQGDRWVLAKPSGFGADNAAVLDAIDAVARLRAESWVADAAPSADHAGQSPDVPSGRFGFGGCSIAITVAADGGARVARVELGREGEGGVYARTSDDPAVFVAPKDLRDRARTWLVDEHALAPSPPIDAVTLERDGKRVAIASDAGDGQSTEDALRVASVLRADAVVHLGAPKPDEGFARPALVATIRGASGTKRVTFGREGTFGDMKVLYARVDGIDATYAVDVDRVKGWLGRF